MFVANKLMMMMMMMMMMIYLLLFLKITFIALFVWLIIVYPMARVLTSVDNL